MPELTPPTEQETLTEYLTRFATDDERARAVREFRSATKGVKVLNEETGLLGGWGIPFGGPVKDKDHPAGKDLDGEYFDESTNFCLDWFPNDNRPVLYDHGADPDVKLDVVGRQVSKFTDPSLGIWVETQLDMAKQYAKYLLELAKKGVLGYSSGALGGYVRRATTGKITQWPWIEETLTVRPANPYALIAADAVKHLEMAGLLQPKDEPPPTLGDALKAELAVAGHTSFSGTHAHDHPAFNTDNPTDGKTHAHEHFHQADTNHDHPHAEAVVTEAKKLTLPDGMSVADLRTKLEDAIEAALGETPGSIDGDDIEAYVTDIRDGFAIASVGKDWDDYFRFPFTIAADGTIAITGAGVEVEQTTSWQPSEGKAASLTAVAEHLESKGWSRAQRAMSARNMGQLHQSMKVLDDLHATTCDMGEHCPAYDASTTKAEEPVDPATEENRQVIEEILAGIDLRRGS